MAKKVLIIDDDPAILQSVEAILKGNGYETITAATGADGINLFKEADPDIVLCDMMMERIDEGVIVAKSIKESNPEKPVYLLSSIGDATASNVSIGDIGFNGVFQKPVNFDQLLSMLEKH